VIPFPGTTVQPVSAADMSRICEEVKTPFNCPLGQDVANSRSNSWPLFHWIDNCAELRSA